MLELAPWEYHSSLSNLEGSYLAPRNNRPQKNLSRQKVDEKDPQHAWDDCIFTYIYICHKNPTIHVGESTKVPLFYMGKVLLQDASASLQFLALALKIRPFLRVEWSLDECIPSRLRFNHENDTTWGLMVSPCKMVVGRRSFPIAKGTFQGRTVKLWGGNWTVGKSVSAK